jgi:uncharacterized protein
LGQGLLAKCQNHQNPCLAAALEKPMSDTVLALYLFAAFIGGLTSGIAGFALSLVLSGVWLHILPPIQVVTLVVGYGLLMYAYSIWKLRHALSWRKVAPFILGGVGGVPVGVLLLAYINPAHVRAGIGLLLVLYCTYSLLRPTIKPIQAGVPADIGVGFLNGLLGGLTGLAGIVVIIWCQFRGWPKDIQRTIFQPVIFAAFLMSAISLSTISPITAETAKLYLFGLPLVLAGTWAGLKLYGRLDEASFRRIVLLLLLVSGVTLIVPASLFR